MEYLITVIERREFNAPEGRRSSGFGSAYLSCPSGGTANGMPRYSSTSAV